MRVKRVNAAKMVRLQAIAPLDEPRPLAVEPGQSAQYSGIKFWNGIDPIPGGSPPAPVANATPPSSNQYPKFYYPYSATQTETNVPPVPPKPTEAGQVADLFKKLGTVASVYKGSEYIITGINNATPTQLAAGLQQYHLVNDPVLAN